MIAYRNDSGDFALTGGAYTQNTAKCGAYNLPTPPPGPCPYDHSLVPVTVTAGQTVSSILIIDWFGKSGNYPPRPVAITGSRCTITGAATRQVVERYFALSTSNDPPAVTDCFAQSWRDRNQQFAAGSELWSHSGPANNLAVTLLDAVNGCDRFRVTAQMPNNRFWTGAQQFFTVGPDAGGPRIYEVGTALVNPSLATTHCP